MEFLGLVLLVVGLTSFTISKIWAAFIILTADPGHGLLGLIPPWSIVALFEEWEKLRWPLLFGTLALIPTVWGFLLVV